METLIKIIGSITFNFSTLELVLSAFVTRLISEDSKIGAIVTCEMSFPNLLKAFDSLAKYKLPPTQYEKIKKIIKQLKSLEQERNAVIHSAYANKENSDEITRLKITAKQKKGLEITAQLIKIDNFKKIANDLVQIVQDLEKLYKEIYKNEMIKFGA